LLPSWVSYCRIGELAVFLDVRRDRYRAMAWESAQPFINAPEASMPTQVARKARALGWLDDASCTIAPAPPACTPLEELAPDVMARTPPPRSVVEALWLLGMTRVHLAMRSLERNLAEVSRRNAATTLAAEGDISATPPILAAFRVAERYALANNTCLLRSLALQAALARRGVATSVVFGVKLHPFEAHCWVQQGPMLLNDTVERTGMFVPIRIVH
jgi:hypothetical protein